VQDGQDTAMPQRLPEELARVRFTPQAIREEQMVRGEVLDDRQRRAGLLEQRQKEPDGLLHFFVGIADQPAGRIED
jgi:hypothetical protein